MRPLRTSSIASSTVANGESLGRRDLACSDFAFVARLAI
jgi:hypothetical protein